MLIFPKGRSSIYIIDRRRIIDGQHHVYDCIFVKSKNCVV